MTIAKAKKMALAMALDHGIGKRLLDPIGNLNKLQAWLLRQTLPAFDDSPGSAAGYEEASRLLLASVHVKLPRCSD